MKLPEKDAREVYRILESESDIRDAVSSELEEFYGEKYELAVEKVTEELVTSDQTPRRYHVANRVRDLDSSYLQEIFRSVDEVKKHVFQEYGFAKTLDDELYVKEKIEDQGRISESEVEEALVSGGGIWR